MALVSINIYDFFDKRNLKDDEEMIGEMLAREF